MNVFFVSTADSKETQLTTDGVEGNAYQGLNWSRDSQALVAWRVEPGDRKQIYWIQSSPRGGGRTVETQEAYAQAGDKYAMCEVNVFDIATMKQIKPQTDRWTDGNYGSARAAGLCAGKRTAAISPTNSRNAATSVGGWWRWIPTPAKCAI